MNTQSTSIHAVLAQEFEEATGHAWADDGPAALRVDNDVDLTVEIDADAARLLVSASIDRDELLLSEAELRLIATASTSAMADIGVAIGLHPVFERAVVAWSARLDELAPGVLTERMETLAAAAIQLETQLAGLRAAAFEPPPDAPAPIGSHLLRA
ncbi:hypothetical protein ACXIUT_16435 [Achromobacter denitrificans]